MTKFPMVPAAPIVALVKEYMEERGDWDVSATARRLGLKNYDQLRRILKGGNISFDLADTIVTNHPEGPMLWWSRPELTKIYVEADLKKFKEARMIRKTSEHGLRSTYVKKGCRCPECKKANTDYMREHHARVKA